MDPLFFWNQSSFKKANGARRLNHNMSVGEFKKIFYMEWLHRNLGRVVGITFVFPALYFGITGRLSKKLKITSFAITSLIGLQVGILLLLL